MTARAATSLVLLCAALALHATAPEAQPLPDSLVWEPVGDVQRAEWLAFDAATLYAGVGALGDGSQPRMVVALRPGEPEWRGVDGTASWYTSGEEAVLEVDGPDFFRRTVGLIRHEAWTDLSAPYGGAVYTLPHRTPSGALVVGIKALGQVAARSTDDGLTWAEHGGPEISPNLTPLDLIVLPPSPEAPLGRLIAAGYGGIATSDDDGVTWDPTPLHADGGLAAQAWAAARIAPGPRDGGHGGAALAVVESAASGVYRSADGRAWERVAAFPGVSPFGARLLAAPDGAVYLYETRASGGSFAVGRAVWRSADGGATWEDVGVVWQQESWSAVPTGLAVGPEGRLWASATGRSQDTSDRLGGVFRTVAPVVAVASEPEPPEASGVGLTVAPNPASGAARVTLRLDAPRTVEVAIYDARGREVWSASGARGQGEHEWAMPGLAPGSYVARAVVEGEAVSVSFVVAR